MRERPIIFSGAMVWAILEGRKTQTRRVLKPQPSEGWEPHSYGDVHKMLDGEFLFRNEEPVLGGWGPSGEDGMEAHPCPFGRPGDRLWVRETFASPVASWTDHGWEWDEDDGARLPGGKHRPSNQFSKRAVKYRADYGDWHQDEGPWRPPIHMPRWASRLTLEVTGVRVERLHDITPDDARAEGHPHVPGTERYPQEVHDDAARDWFMDLWDGLNAKRGHPWDSNPWVWVVTFRRLEEARDA